MRTDSVNGIHNGDWFVTLFADGYQPATEPGNPKILYSHWQGGNLVRVDRTTGERVYIQPQGEPGDAPERFNWDAPVLVSPHAPTRIYHASQRVWRSDDRGDSWRAISPDLTRNQDRMKLPLMGRQWSWDAAWDLVAMSTYGTITSLAESPKAEGVIYAGTDDGILQVTEDGGKTWRKIELATLPGVPATAFVNDMKADLFDANTVYVALDDHKNGDFKPYLLKSTDRGRTWKSIAGDLPARHLVWRVVQDHVKPNLLFAGTEFGLFFTVDGGARWIELGGDVPTIAFRDLAIQRRENDLVAGSFGRGIFVLDDYSALRELSEDVLAKPAALFPPRRALWYVERDPFGEPGKASLGAAFFTAPNPPFGAVFTYHLAEELKSREKKRQEQEKPLVEAGKDTPFPGWDAVEAERREAKPKVLLVVRDGAGSVLRRVDAPAGKGFHRAAWDLRLASTRAIADERPRDPDDEEDDRSRGVLAAPGRYTVSLEQRDRRKHDGARGTRGVRGRADASGRPARLRAVGDGRVRRARRRGAAGHDGRFAVRHAGVHARQGPAYGARRARAQPRARSTRSCRRSTRSCTRSTRRSAATARRRRSARADRPPSRVACRWRRRPRRRPTGRRRRTAAAWRSPRRSSRRCASGSTRWSSRGCPPSRSSSRRLARRGRRDGRCRGCRDGGEQLNPRIEPEPPVRAGGDPAGQDFVGRDARGRAREECLAPRLPVPATRRSPIRRASRLAQACHRPAGDLTGQAGAPRGEFPTLDRGSGCEEGLERGLRACRASDSKSSCR